jgi:hypothetical protein
MSALSEHYAGKECPGDYPELLWRPIATAPRDGTEILVWCPAVQGELSPKSAGAHIDKWNTGRWWRSFPAQQPTHWMRLPKGPALPQAQSDGAA